MDVSTMYEKISSRFFTFCLITFFIVMITSINLVNAFEVFPADSKPYGLTYGQWAAKWWQWSYSIPEENNPIKDTTGKDCAINQSGPVWFLAGTAGGSAERTCTIPEGKAIMFPIINWSCDAVTNPSFKTEAELAKCASPYQHVSMEVSVDGNKINDLENYKTFSPLYNFTMAEGNDLGLPAGTKNEAVSYGYWIMLEPLIVGTHDIQFKGIVTDFTVTAPSTFITEVTYHLNVK